MDLFSRRNDPPTISTADRKKWSVLLWKGDYLQLRLGFPVYVEEWQDAIKEARRMLRQHYSMAEICDQEGKVYWRAECLRGRIRTLVCNVSNGSVNG